MSKINKHKCCFCGDNKSDKYMIFVGNNGKKKFDYCCKTCGILRGYNIVKTR